MKNKIDSWKFWLDLNEHIYKVFGLAGLGIAITALMKNLPFEWLKNVALIIVFFMILLMFMQLILGIRQIGVDTKEWKNQQEQLQKPKASVRKAKI